MLKQTFIVSALLLGLTACQGTDLTKNNSTPLEGSWHIEAIQGKPVIDYSPAHITFEAEGKLHGNNSCNNFLANISSKTKNLN